MATGFGNHNWRVPLGSGAVLLKIGPVSSASKWAGAQIGLDRARVAGVPVPQVRSTRIVGEHVVRTLDWVAGTPALTLTGDAPAQARLGAELGTAVARLHAVEVDGFSSRLDGSSAVFSTWNAYVNDRLAAIDHRAQANNAPESVLRRRAAEVIESLAASVAGDCPPVVCHRDLHPGNVIVEPDGSLAGITDWDMAVAWDAAGEWFKLELFFFDRLPHARNTFEAAYVANAPAVGLERRRLVLLMESLNLVANAGVFAPDFVSFGVEQLERLA